MAMQTRANYYETPKGCFSYGFDSRLGLAIGLLVGRKHLNDLDDDDCLSLGYQEEIRKIDGKTVTAETVQRLCSESDVKRKAESIVGTVIVNLMHKCNDLSARCEELAERLAELESLEALAEAAKP